MLSYNEERFWPKVNVKDTNECWNWKASLFDSGYGQFKVDDKSKCAHRVSWEFANGIIPEDKLILHTCDNRKCVNPKHLYCGTYLDNARDRCNRNPTSPELSGYSNARFYEGEIFLIRKILNSKRFKQPYIAKIFKVNQSIISRIKTKEYTLCREGYYV